MASDGPTMRTRARRSLKPIVILRSVTLSAIGVIAMPIVAILVLLGIGVLFGSVAASSASIAFGQGLGITVAITLVASIALLVSTLSVARVNTAAHAGTPIGGTRSLGRTLRTILPLLAALILGGIALIVAIVGWLPLTAAMVVIAIVLQVRHRRSGTPGRVSRGTRRALIAAIPFLLAVLVLALLPATVAASIGGARTLPAMLRGGARIVRHTPLRLVAFVIVAGGSSALLTLGATSILANFGADSDWILPVGGLALMLLTLTTGIALAILAPRTVTPHQNSERAVREARPLLTPRGLRIARVSMIAIIAVISTFVPAATASADGSDPVPASPVVAVAPTLKLSVDGLGPVPTFTATVSVPDGSSPAGVVQLLDGDRLIGDPVTLTVNSATSATAIIASTPAPGVHNFAFRFSAATTAVTSGDSPVTPWTYTAPATVAPTPMAPTVKAPAIATRTFAAASAPTVVTAVPTLELGVDGLGPAPQLTAFVTVPDGSSPAGTVQLLEGDEVLGAPITLTVLSATTAQARLSSTTNFDPGVHNFAFRFSAATTDVESGDSPITAWTYTAKTVTTITATAPGSVFDGTQPVTLTVTVKPTGTITTVVPTGTVDVTTFNNNLDEVVVTVPLVNGSATLTPTEFGYTRVFATYSGSDQFKTSDADVFVDEPTGPQATDLFVSTSNGPWTLGTEIPTSVSVSTPDAPFGFEAQGRVEVWDGTVLLVSPKRLPAAFGIPTSSLHAGDTSLRFEYLPDDDSTLASEETKTVHLEKAATSLTATQSGSTVAKGDAYSITAIVHSDVDGTVTVEVRTSADDMLVASAPVTVTNGSGTVKIDLTGALPIGQNSLVTTVTPDDDHAGATSPAVVGLTTPIRTVTTLQTSPPVVGTPATLTATVTSPAYPGTEVPGPVVFVLPDGTQRTVNLVDGVATTTVTTEEVRTSRISATFFDTGFTYAQSGAVLDFTPSLAMPAPPIVTYPGSLTPNNVAIHLAYPTSGTLDAPYGTVDILDAANTVVGTGLLFGDGTVDIQATVTGIHPVLRAEYRGNPEYAPREDLLTVPTLTNYSPTVLVTAPFGTALGADFPISVAVTNVPVGLVASVTLGALDSTGGTTTLGTVALDSSGHASTTAYLLVAGTTHVSATVTYSGASDLTPTVSEATDIEVAAVPVPVLTLSANTTGLSAGNSLDLHITASGVASGSVVTIRDQNEVAIATVTVTLGSGTYHFTNLPGGTERLHATVIYGPARQLATASSSELVFTVSPPFTHLTIQTTSPQAGTDVVATVTATPLGNLSGASRSITATVTVDGVARSATLTRTSDTGTFTGTASFPTVHAGFFGITATTVDGIDTAAATYSTVVQVIPRATELRVLVDTPQAGAPIRVGAVLTQVGSATSPEPTGLITLSTGSSAVSCTVVSGDYCTLPVGAIREGSNTVSAYYAGDPDNSFSQGSTIVTAGPRTSDLAVSFSPTPGNWVVGRPVTATWTTTTSGSAASGFVDVKIGIDVCEGRAAADSCVLKVYSDLATPFTIDWSAKFYSSDDAPNALVSGTAATTLCVYPFAPGSRLSFPVEPQCSPGGLLYGKPITATAQLRTDYKVGTWTVNGASYGHAGQPSITLPATGSVVIGYQDVYSPLCYTLNISPLYGDRNANKGYLSAFRVTQNCYDPQNPTTQDAIDLAAGHPRFKAGTLVYIDANPVDNTIGLATFTGATLLDDPLGYEQDSLPGKGLLATVTMDHDVTVNATFKVLQCVPVTVVQSDGGTVVVTAAQRPQSSGALLPATGACTTRTGQSGYIPGTTLSIRATPDAGNSVVGFTNTGWDSYFDQNRYPLDTTVLATAKAPAASGPQTTDYVVPSSWLVDVAARFSGVKCVSFVTKQWNVAPTYLSAIPAHDLTIALKGGTSAGCGGIPTTRTQARTSAAQYLVTTITTSLVAEGTVEVSTDQPDYYPDNLGISGAHGSVSAVNWPTSTDPAALWQGIPNYQNGPVFDLTKAKGTITAEAQWSTGCENPKVALPQGGGYDVSIVYPDEPLCVGQSGVIPSGMRGGLLTAHAAPAGTTLTPIFTDVTTGATAINRTAAWSYDSYGLEYCAPIGLDVNIVDDAGHSHPISQSEYDQVLSDDGGCPSRWARAGALVATGLTDVGSYEYTVVGNTKGLGPLRAVSLTGAVSGPTAMSLKVTCFTLTTDDADIATPGNCPGGAANRFLRGTVVELDADYSGGRFDGWNNVDGQYSETGYVLMTADRFASADIHHYSTWEKIGNALSSVAQRVVSVAFTAATGVILGELYLVKAVATVASGVSMGLRALGVSGAALDGIDQGVSIINAQLTMVSQLSTCTANFVSGGSPVLTVAQPSPTALMNAGTSFDAITAAGKQTLQDALNAKSGAKTTNLGNSLGTAGNVINALGSNLAGYSADAANSWSQGYSQVSSCMQAGASAWATTTSGG